MITTRQTGPADSPTHCARCSEPTVTARDAAAWCPRCEWNLDRYEPDRRRPEFGWRWVDRRTHALAYRLTRRQFAELSEGRLDPSRTSPARLVLVTSSVLLFAGVLLLAAAGAWLLATYPLLSPAPIVAVALIGLAVALRPRFGRVDPLVEELSTDRAPELLALVAEVAAAIGVPPPHVVALDHSFNAYATAVGPRRRRVLCLGLPLWAALQPQERVALLGHELGHFGNGDVRRGLLTQPAFTTLGSAADLIRPVDTVGGAPGLVGMLADAIAKAFQWTLSRLLFSAQLVLLWVGLREIQRAEFLADEFAARAAGSAAAVGLLDASVTRGVVEMMVRREARAGLGPAHWRTAAAEARAANAAHLPVLRQLSIRDEVSLFASHPPAGLRSRMAETREWRSPAVVLGDARVDRIDAELAAEYEKARRTIAWSS